METTRRKDQKARSQALHDLAKASPRKFRQLLNARRAALGLPPVGITAPGPKPKKSVK